MSWQVLLIDPRGRPQSRPVVITIFTQSVCQSIRTYVCPSVHPSVRPSVPKLQNQATITAGRDCGLAEWIIDDSCLVSFKVTLLIYIKLKNQGKFGRRKKRKNKKLKKVISNSFSMIYAGNVTKRKSVW